MSARPALILAGSDDPMDPSEAKRLHQLQPLLRTIAREIRGITHGQIVIHISSATVQRVLVTDSVVIE